MSEKYTVTDRREAGLPSEPEPEIKFRVSPIRAPYAGEDNLVQEPGETPMDDTNLLAYGCPRFRKQEKTVTILSAKTEVVQWYKQLFAGPRCACIDKEESSTIEKAYCPICYHTGIEGGYTYYKRVKILEPHIEWGAVDPPFPSGQLGATLDFEYHLTPGDFFELGKVVANVGFNADAGVSERHDNEGLPCLWRVLDVEVVKDDTGFPLGWSLFCRNVEHFEPIYGWFSKNTGLEK